MHYESEKNQLKSENLSSLPPFLEDTLFNVHPSFFFFFFSNEYSIDRNSREQGCVFIWLKKKKNRLCAPREHLILRNPMASYGRRDVNKLRRPLSWKKWSLLSLIMSSNFRERVRYCSSQFLALFLAAKSHSKPSLSGWLLSSHWDFSCIHPAVLNAFFLQSQG